MLVPLITSFMKPELGSGAFSTLFSYFPGNCSLNFSQENPAHRYTEQRTLLAVSALKNKGPKIYRFVLFILDVKCKSTKLAHLVFTLHQIQYFHFGRRMCSKSSIHLGRVQFDPAGFAHISVSIHDLPEDLFCGSTFSVCARISAEEERRQKKMKICFMYLFRSYSERRLNWTLAQLN
jgi:hypothetical protein